MRENFQNSVIRKKNNTHAINPIFPVFLQCALPHVFAWAEKPIDKSVYLDSENDILFFIIFSKKGDPKLAPP